MSNITKSFGKLCKFFLKNNCQKICTIQKKVLPLHRFSAFKKDEGIAPQWSKEKRRE